MIDLFRLLNWLKTPENLSSPLYQPQLKPRPTFLHISSREDSPEICSLSINPRRLTSLGRARAHQPSPLFLPRLGRKRWKHGRRLRFGIFPEIGMREHLASFGALGRVERE